jgi:hypothetical protein
MTAKRGPAAGDGGAKEAFDDGQPKPATESQSRQSKLSDREMLRRAGIACALVSGHRLINGRR